MTTAKLIILTIGSAWLLALSILIVMPQRPRKRVVARLGGFVWIRENFCRGWLIGDTGSGKTRSGITPLLHQVFTNEPTWGGLCIDDKGLYWETLCAMANYFGREDDRNLLQVRPEGEGADWKPLRKLRVRAVSQRSTINAQLTICPGANTFDFAEMDHGKIICVVMPQKS
jgi:hypothetical protein